MPTFASEGWRRQSMQTDTPLHNICYVPSETISGNMLLLQRESDGWPGYKQDLLEMLTMLPHTYMDVPFRIRWGDCVDLAQEAIATKARRIGDENALVLPLNYDRHLGPAFHELITGTRSDYPFWDKIPKALWRGTSTGHGWDPAADAPENHRRFLVERWAGSGHPKVDVGITEMVQELAPGSERRDHWQPFVKEFMPVNEQRKYRYLIAVEGNDVASGLKWMLASNSVVFMPIPRYETWIEESALKPYTHFVPLKHDFTDLLSKIDWCENNWADCYAISQRATDYMRGFANRSAMFEQGAAKLRAHLDARIIQGQETASRVCMPP